MLSNVNPEAWLRDVLTRIGDGCPANRVLQLVLGLVTDTYRRHCLRPLRQDDAST